LELDLRTPDGKTRVSVRPLGYYAKCRKSRKRGPSYRFTNQVKYNIDYEGHDVKRSIGDRSISTYDIERICAAADAVLSGKAKELTVSSQKRDLKLTLAKMQERFQLSLEIAADQGRITICLNDLDRAAFCGYCAAFHSWKILYPILRETELNRTFKDPEKEASNIFHSFNPPGSANFSRFDEMMAENRGENWRDELWGEFDDLLGDDEELDL
jgi:hypothetical protein